MRSMMPWFIWKGRNSLAEGLWINKLPKIIRPAERTRQVEIPGRSGSLTLLEGDEVYDGYTKECTVIAANHPDIEKVLDWLRGEGDLIFCNEDQYVYHGRIAGAVEFQRISNDMMQAMVPFFVDPFKRARHPEKHRVTQTAETGTIRNLGNVASRPLVHITREGNTSITIGGKEMRFTRVTGTIDVDCDAQIVTKNGEAWTDGTVTGDFWTIPTGESEITRTNSCTIDIEPRWRWI